MKEDIKYVCEICGNSYNTKEEALECEKKPIQEQKYNIGDIIQTLCKTAEIVDAKVEGHDVVYHVTYDGTGDYDEIIQDEIIKRQMTKEEYEKTLPLGKLVQRAIEQVIRTNFKFDSVFVIQSDNRRGSLSYDVICFYEE